MHERRVLDDTPPTTFRAFRDMGGGSGLDAARRLGAESVLDEIEASGLRGRGGAGFPTGVKWRTIADHAVPDVPTTVVINAAEGEPGTFKDRAILRSNPYRVVEGALIAALAVGGADRIVVAAKQTFAEELGRLHDAIIEVESEGWCEGVVEFQVFSGPTEYLFGEETGLLEALNGRLPFPRVSPPWRRGADEIGRHRRSASQIELAGPGDATLAPPTLVNNVETLANVPGICARGASWFRSVGTDESPGTAVFTVTGDTRRAGVGELPLGTPLSEVIDAVGGGAERAILGVLPGVASPILPGSRLDVPASYEGMQEAGSGLGAAGLIVFDETRSPVAVAESVARFLAVESCGQCTPCKRDGLTMVERLHDLRVGEAGERDVAEVEEALGTVTEGARCYLAHQQHDVIESLLDHFSEAVKASARPAATAHEPFPIAPIVDIADGVAEIDARQLEKQPDWSYGGSWSGDWPAEAAP